MKCPAGDRGGSVDCRTNAPQDDTVNAPLAAGFGPVDAAGRDASSRPCLNRHLWPRKELVMKALMRKRGNPCATKRLAET